jgi:hypothetical protein
VNLIDKHCNEVKGRERHCYVMQSMQVEESQLVKGVCTVMIIM